MSGRLPAAGRRSLLAAALVLLGVPVAVAVGGAGDAGRTTQISQRDAVASLRVVLGDAALTARADGFAQSATSRAFLFRGQDFDAAVDVATGEIGYITRFAQVPTDRTVRINEQAALERAQALIRQGHISAPEGAPSVTLIDHGTALEYRVIWAKRVGNVLVPDQVVVRISPQSGDWFSLVRVHRDYAPPPQPKFSAAQAESVARRSVGDATLVGQDLNVAFDATGRQRLLWSLRFVSTDAAGYQAADAILIDALTGMKVDLADLGVALP